MSEEKPTLEFRQAIDDAIAVVEAERKAQEERELAEKNRLEKARQKAMMVREIIIIPLLNDLRNDFAAARKKVLPEWQVQSDGDVDKFFATAATPNLGAGGSTYFTIKAAASVAEHGAALDLSVVCSRVDPKNTASQLPPLYGKTKSTPMLKFDDLGSQMWFHKQLEECARMCVLTRMRQSRNGDADCVPQAPVDV